MRAIHPIRLAHMAAAMLIASVGVNATSTPAAAQQFLAGQSDGMNRCVRAILRGYTLKRVNVHGHHFNCLPLRRWDAQRRTLVIYRNRRLQDDDAYVVWFRVNRVRQREYVKVNSVEVIVTRGFYNLDQLTAEFKGPPGIRRPRNQDYDYFVERAWQVRPRELSNWRHVAQQIRDIVIATLGEPWP